MAAVSTLTCSMIIFAMFSVFNFKEVDAAINQKPPPYIICDVNAPAVLTFRASSEPDFFIPTANSCSTENRSLISSGVCQTVGDRFSCSTNDSEQLYSVRIKECHPADAGTYVTRNNNGDPKGDTAFTELVVLRNWTESLGSLTRLDWQVCGHAQLVALCAGGTAQLIASPTDASTCRNYSVQLDSTDVLCSMTLSVSSQCDRNTSTVQWNASIAINVETTLPTQTTQSTSRGVQVRPSVVCVALFVVLTTVSLLVATSNR